MLLPFPFPSARILEFTWCPAAQRAPLTSWQPEHWVESLRIIKFAFPIQLHFLSLEQRTISPHDSLCFYLKTENSSQATQSFFLILSRERKAIYHLRRLTVLTIFQPFWHRFFWNCLKTSATLVALFKCTSRESFRRREAWTFTTLEGWTRQAKRKKCLKKDSYQSKHSFSK